MAQAHAMKGMAAETSAECGKVLAATSGAFSMQTTGLCVWALGVAGRTDEARRLLPSLEHPPAGVWLDPAIMASAYGGVGDIDRALEWTERGLTVRGESR
jgi:hypothetical protein